MNYNPVKKLIILVLLNLSFGGCAANLPAIREFSQSTIATSSSFNDITDDMPESCYRRVEFSSRQMEQIYTIDAPPPESLSKDYLSDCNQLKNSLVGVYDANDVLRGYAVAIGKLASNDVVTFDKEIATLENNMRKVVIDDNKPFDDPKVAAISSIAKLLFTITTEGYRQKKLKDAIEMANPHVKKTVDGLIKVVDIYKIQLDSETDTINEFQKDSDELLKRIEGTEPIVKEKLIGGCKYKRNLIDKDPLVTFYCKPVIFILVDPSLNEKYKQISMTNSDLKSNYILLNLLQVQKVNLKQRLVQYTELLGSVDEERNAANKLQEALRDVETTHQEIYENRNKLTSKEIAKQVQKYSNKVGELADQMEKAFRGSD
ncbi:MAG: hypothetical protein WBD99_16300 [Thermodesulfobacteriota bacterium]